METIIVSQLYILTNNEKVIIFLKILIYNLSLSGRMFVVKFYLLSYVCWKTKLEENLEYILLLFSSYLIII